MDILDKENGKFVAMANGEQAGLLTYVWSGEDKFIIDHTEVAENHKGEVVGKELVKYAVDFARKKGVKVMPLCPFAAAEFRKNEDYSDVKI